MKPMNKKGVLQGLEDLMQGLGTVVIIMVVIFLIIAQAKTQVISINACTQSGYVFNTTTNMCSPNGNATDATYPSVTMNATIATQGAVGQIPPWLPLIVIVTIGGLLLTLVRYMRKK